MHDRYSVTTLVLLLEISSLLSAQTPDDEAFEADQRAAFARIDEVLPWDTSALPFVIEKQRAVDVGRPWETLRRIGFVVHDSASRRTVRLIDGGVVSIDKTGARSSDEEAPLWYSVDRLSWEAPPAEFEPIGMAEVATHVSALLRRLPVAARYVSIPGHMTIDERALLLARHAARRGLEEESRSLCRAVLARARGTGDYPRATGWELRTEVATSRESTTSHWTMEETDWSWPTATLSALVDRFIESFADWRNSMDFEDPTLSWADLLENHRRFVKQFPQSERSSTIRRRIINLEILVEQETERRKAGRPMIFDTGLPTADLVWLLRNDIDGRVSDELVQRRREAAPALLSLLDSNLPARRIERFTDIFLLGVDHRDPEVIAGLAKAVLERIQDRRERNPSSKPIDIPYWRRWIEHLSRQDEKTLLLDSVRSFDLHAADCAERLAASYPDSAIELLRIARLCPDEDLRAQLIYSLRNCMDPVVLEELEVELDAPSRNTSLVAARILCKRGIDRGIDRVIGKCKGEDQAWTFVIPWLRDADIVALLESGAPRAVTVAIGALHDEFIEQSFEALHGIRHFIAARIRDGAKIPAEIETGLLGCMNDLTPRFLAFPDAWQHPRTGKTAMLAAPSVAEVAASTLEWISAERYPFDVMAPRRARLAAIRQMQRKAGIHDADDLTPGSRATEADRMTADHVVAVTMIPPSDIERDAGRLLQAMLGKPLDPAAVGVAFETAVREASAGAFDIWMTVDRQEQGGGIAISLQRAEGDAASRSDNFYLRSSLTLDRVMLDSDFDPNRGWLDALHHAVEPVVSDLEHLVATPGTPSFEIFTLVTFH